MKNQKGFAWLPVLLGLVVVLALGGVYVYQTQKQMSTFSASLTSGVAPLAVTFSGKNGISLPGVAQEMTVWIDFGDGIHESIYDGSFSRSHTYTSPGIYTAKLAWRSFGPASSNFPTYTLGTETITVR